MEKTFVVYRLKNTVNGRVYFGSTKDFAQRVRQHLSAIERCSIGKGGMYVRDAIHHGHRTCDFSIRIVARFDNQADMLEREQTLLDMYWGTKHCYNHAFEVWPGAVRKTLVAWNMKTLETRQYLSCHAAGKDLEVDKALVRRVLEEKKRHVNSWVVEMWSKRRTVREVLELYRQSRIQLPEFALRPSRKGGHTSIPGYCSIAELVYRRRFFRGYLNSSTRLFSMIPNNHERFLYGWD